MNTVTLKTHDEDIITIPIKDISTIINKRNVTYDYNVSEYLSIIDANGDSLTFTYFEGKTEKADRSRYSDLEPGDYKVRTGYLDDAIKVLNRLRGVGFLDDDEYQLYLSSILDTLCEYYDYETEEIEKDLKKKIEENTDFDLDDEVDVEDLEEEIENLTGEVEETLVS